MIHHPDHGGAAMGESTKRGKRRYLAMETHVHSLPGEAIALVRIRRLPTKMPKTLDTPPDAPYINDIYEQ